jgi:hypothetical protein
MSFQPGTCFTFSIADEYRTDKLLGLCAHTQSSLGQMSSQNAG